MRHEFRILMPLFGFLTLPGATALAASPCPDDARPRMIVALKKREHTLYICGDPAPDSQPAKGFRSVADVKIYAKQTPDKKKRKKKSKAADETQAPPPEPKLILEGNALETLWVKKDEDKLLVDEIWMVTDKETPVLRREITCSPKKCKVSKPLCQYKPKKKPFPDALKELRSSLKGPTANPDTDQKTLVSQVFAQGLSGDAKAVAFFLYGKIPTGLSPEASEEWHAAKSQLYKARKLHCVR